MAHLFLLCTTTCSSRKGWRETNSMGVWQQDNPVTLEGEGFNKNYALAIGNLAYSYFTGEICEGFVSFQKEKQAEGWSEDEKRP